MVFCYIVMEIYQLSSVYLVAQQPGLLGVVEL